MLGSIHRNSSYQKKSIGSFLIMKKMLILFGSIFILFFLSQFFSNVWMLMTDSSNYIPEDSNILTLKITQVDEGSGGYWRYAQDHKNYYYFSEKEVNTYYQIALNHHCENFNKLDVQTWCEVKKFQRK